MPRILAAMRSYNQYCGLAKALDVVGDRWILLVVRELLAHDGARYTDLRDGLPGIATNMLAGRLRDMERAGLVIREDAPPPVATTLFRLTPRGRQLEPVIRALGAWAGPLMGEWTPGQEFRSRWLALPVELYLTDGAPDAPPVALQLRTGDEPMVVEVAGGMVRARPGTAAHAAAELAGPPHVVMGLLAGRLSLAAARAKGLHFRGALRAVRRLRPRS